MSVLLYHLEDAPAGSRTRGTSMGGLYVAATLQVRLNTARSETHNKVTCQNFYQLVQQTQLPNG